MIPSSKVTQPGTCVTIHVPGQSGVATAPKFNGAAPQPPRVVIASELRKKFSENKKEYGRQAAKFVATTNQLLDLQNVPKDCRDKAWLKQYRHDKLEAESAEFLMGRLILARRVVESAWVDNHIPGPAPSLGYARLQGPYL